jgi:DNA-directed RNA polymerase specialized sigma24 family protein
MDDEHSLIMRVLSGDTDAWHSFVETYSPQMEKTIGRYVREPDTAHDLFVSLLDKLKNGKLERFDFRASLATWLFTVARNHCRDYYRTMKGVRHILKALEGLGSDEKRFFKLYYIQGMSLRETFESMRVESRGSLRYLDIFECHQAVRKRIAEKKLGRLLDRLLRPSSEPVRLDAPGAGYRFDRDETSEAQVLSPDSHVDGKNLPVAIGNLRKAVMQLPHRDQLVLKLRFEHKRSAREIGEMLDLGNEKQVYRKLDRLMEELRSMLLELGLPDETYRETVEDIETICRYVDVWRAPSRPGGEPFS